MLPGDLTVPTTTDPCSMKRVMTSRGTRCLASRQSPLDRAAGTFPRPALESANQGARRSRHSTTSALLRPFRASKLLWGDTCRTRGPASGSEAALGGLLKTGVG